MAWHVAEVVQDISATANSTIILWRAFKTASVSGVKEPAGLSRDDGKRPDDVTLLPWAKQTVGMGCHSTRHSFRLPRH